MVRRRQSIYEMPWLVGSSYLVVIIYDIEYTDANYSILPPTTEVLPWQKLQISLFDKEKNASLRSAVIIVVLAAAWPQVSRSNHTNTLRC